MQMQQLKLQFTPKELKIGDVVRILSKHNDTWDLIPWEVGDVGVIGYKCDSRGFGGILYFLTPIDRPYQKLVGYFKFEDLEVIEHARV